MAFDSQTRNKLQRMVGACRRLLTDEFDDQLQGLYGIYAQDGRVLDLEKLTTLDDDNYQIATLLRDRVKHLTSGMASEKQPLAEAVRRVLREQAFTVLNRFAALRMAEERGFVQECVGQGLKSKGFQVFETVARSGLGGAYARYVTFIHGMFDELSLDLGVLFDRWSPFGLLFPREPALLKFFELLNDPELKPLWKEDETVGWIYQYFNDEAERKKMREESSAPRNSRELAVRNQFFTPRYVVEFLTDNTLGRIWYEMTRGETKLKEQCRYLVRRPNEIFLKAGATAPEQQTPPATASQEDLLKQPIQIPHRPLKDPRTILMLDPACGSMHFGLYGFDLFEVIYEEAWELEKRGAEFQPRPPGMLSLQETYGTKEDFLKDVPRLIIEHNLHGIDIDPRCAQIAGLSLWLRAQKAWQRFGLKPAERPAIKRSNIVCAEPMPGEKELLREFVEREFPVEERGVCLRLLEAIFDKMQLAGEAGSLLKIEEEIRSAIEDARRQWQTARQRPEFFDADQLAALDTRAGAQQELPAAERAAMAADLRSLTSEDFWLRIEQRIYDALRDYAEQAENGGGFQRRLFAEDAARGFAFIDVCRKRYDVALMNPPFGDCTPQIEAVMRKTWDSIANDIYAIFLALAAERLGELGLIGAITSRGFLVGRDQRDFRPLILGKGKAVLELFVDLGLGVLDAAEVETCCYTIRRKASRKTDSITFYDFTERERDELDQLSNLLEESAPTIRSPAIFHEIAQCPIMYRADQGQIEAIGSQRSLDPYFGRVTRGLNSSDDERFLRLFWEVPQQLLSSRWYFCAKGAEYMWFFPNICTVVDWLDDGRLIEAHTATISENVAQARRSSRYYFKPAVTFTYRCNDFSLRSLPANCIFTNSAPVIIPKRNEDLVLLLAVFLSKKYEGFLKLISKKGKYDTGRMAQLPAPDHKVDVHESLQWKALISYLFRFESRVEESPYFATPARDWTDKLDTVKSTELVIRFAELSGLEPSRSFADRAKRSFVERFNDGPSPAEKVLSYAIGSSFGRWDIRYATGEKAAPELRDPFAPLPVCPPGQLQNAEGLPACPEDVPAAYPVRIPWAGILVDDPNHPLDIERRVREVIEIIWGSSAGGSTAEAIEHEACEILGVKSLRDYFRKPAGFFADHLSRYSKSRRQAPIYWPLSTASGSYTLWIYYHRLTDQTLFQCVNDFVKPKLEEVNRDIERLRGEVQRADGGSSKQRETLEELEDFTIELKEFHDELLRVAGLPYKPNLNDGVLITASPLWKLFRLPKWQKDLKACWESLEAGEYDWAHLAYTIWPDRVKEVCKKDRSIAIAHGLEHLCEVKAPEKKGKGRKKKDEQMELEEGNE